MKTIALSMILLPLLFACESPKQETKKPHKEATTSGLIKPPGIELTFIYDFETFDTKGLPKGWKVGETNGQGKPAQWGKVPGRQGHGFGVLKTENSGSTFNMARLKGLRGTDFVAELWVKARTGQEDQGGGLVWHAKDFDNYYICRWNPLEDNFRFYKVENGRRKMLATSRVKADPKSWHKMKIEMKGPKVKISFDGEPKIQAEDHTFPTAGYFGLWTKADAATSFDDLQIHWN